MPRLTVGWKRRPPLYGPMALFISMRKPRLTWTSPLSSTHGTRNMITRSGSQMRSRIFAFWYFGFFSMNGTSDSTTSRTAWWNSFSPGFFAMMPSMKAFTASDILSSCYDTLGR